MKATTASIKAFDKAKWAMRGIHNTCSDLMERDNISDEDRERILTFRRTFSKSIDPWDEDGSDRARRRVIEEATTFLAGYGIEHKFSGWVYTSPPAPVAPAPACAPGRPAAAPARTRG